MRRIVVQKKVALFYPLTIGLHLHIRIGTGENDFETMGTDDVFADTGIRGLPRHRNGYVNRLGMLPGHIAGVVKNILQRVALHKNETARNGGAVKDCLFPLPIVTDKTGRRRIFGGGTERSGKQKQ